ncbi:MAG: DegT/DnrJ/EryC1/StrS family aminotransferase [Candidatus Hydrogenedentota bacterium]|nr:MAG: DegT/DnrJ/EryC1/StrS family aminotransferase [Candidatus Hydrogenedentota bacterium]
MRRNGSREYEVSLENGRPRQIPIMKPTLPPFEEMLPDLEEVFRSGQLTLGPYVHKFEERVAEYLGVKHIIGCSSGTSGLLALFSLFPKGKRVLLPAFTFSATLQALRWNRLEGVPVDCDERGNIDPEEVERELSKGGVGGIVGVHMFGHPADVERLEELAAGHGVRLFFDAAHAFGASRNGRKAGGFGDGEVFSLGPTKTMPTGEGGLIATNDDGIAEHLRLFINHGHPPGDLDCRFDSLNARLQEVNAVVGLHLLDKLDDWIIRRNMLADRYDEGLRECKGVTTCSRDRRCVSTVKDYAVFIDPKNAGKDRDEIARRLAEEGVMTRKYYWPPVHRLSFVKREYEAVSCPRAERLAEQTLSLPLYSHMPVEEQNYVLAKIRGILSQQ